MVFRLFLRSVNRAFIDRLSGEIVAAACPPALFTEYGIADSVDGRFETLTLHAALVQRRFNRMLMPRPNLLRISPMLSFAPLMPPCGKGGGDITVRKHMTAIANAFLGRAAAYDRALNGGAPYLRAALLRNVYNGHGNPDRLARYVEAATNALATASLDV